MHLKSGRSAENGAYTWKGATSRVMVATKLKLTFGQMAAPGPEIMDHTGNFTIIYTQVSNVISSQRFLNELSVCMLYTSQQCFIFPISSIWSICWRVYIMGLFIIQYSTDLNTSFLVQTFSLPFCFKFNEYIYAFTHDPIICQQFSNKISSYLIPAFHLPVLSFECKLHASHQIICLQYKKHLAIDVF
jgi:hypothetical protein